MGNRLARVDILAIHDFVKNMIPVYLIYTGVAVVATSIFLVMIMTTPLETEAAKYKDYIKNVWLAWFFLELCPTFLVACYNYAVNGNMLHW